MPTSNKANNLTLLPAFPARPSPPEQLCEISSAQWLNRFAPDDNLWEWIRSTFLETGSPLENPDHKHLLQAHVGMLWTNVGNGRHMRRIIGQAEMPMMRGSKWGVARQEMQMRDWFGDVPDFVITLDAKWCDEADDASFCALVEHELTHCAQKRNLVGVPLFSRSTGKPLFAMRGHDVEEFVGVVARYGATGPAVLELAMAAMSKPAFDVAKLATVCGTQVRKAA